MIEIKGADAAYEKRIREALAFYPGWFIRAARISRIEVSNRRDVLDQIAMYEHGTRVLFIMPNAGTILLKAIGHEVTHGVDDIWGVPHFYTASSTWVKIHSNQAYFDIPKYMDEPLEYFADMVSKCFILGPEKLRTTNPKEVEFICGGVFPQLISLFA